MQTITNITSDYKQKLLITIYNQEQLTIKLEYSISNYQWIMSLEYLDKSINGIRVCLNSNLLYQWKNILPFGIACLSFNNAEPYLVEDFLSGNVVLYILDNTEI